MRCWRVGWVAWGRCALAALELELSSCPHVSLGAFSCKKALVKGIPESAEMSRAVGYSALSHNMEHSTPHRPLWWPSELSTAFPSSFLSSVLQVTSCHRPGSNTGPPTRAQCCWELRCATDVSTVSAVWLLCCFLSLVPGMATRLQNWSMKKLSQQSSDVRKADFSLVAVCTECLLLWGKWEKTIILKSLMGWWLIRTVHHRETCSGVNRCLFCILQPVMEKN